MIDIKYGNVTPPFETSLNDPAIIRDVYVGETPIDEAVVDIRIREEPPDHEWEGPAYQYILEAAVKCEGAVDDDNGNKVEGCGTINWILIGSDPGDYRCIKCTSWL